MKSLISNLNIRKSNLDDRLARAVEQQTWIEYSFRTQPGNYLLMKYTFFAFYIHGPYKKPLLLVSSINRIYHLL